MNTNKVAVLMAAYNGQDFIEEQIESILSQKNISLRLFISLDRSIDGTYEIITKYISMYPEIISILPYGERFGSSCKNFIRLIKDAAVDDFEYDFVAFCDQDDIWEEDKLSNGMKSLLDNHCDGYSSNVTAFWPDGRTALVKKSHNKTEYDYLFEAPGPGCTFVLKKALFVSIRDFIKKNSDKIDRLWMHDWFCYSFARYNGFKWHIDDQSSMSYRQHESNVVGANHGVGSLVTRAKIVFSGEAFDKVIQQAVLLGQQNEKPVKILLSGSRISFLKLFLISFKLRRNPLHKLYMGTIFLLFIFIGYKNKTVFK